jgi:hypothetical protein
MVGLRRAPVKPSGRRIATSLISVSPATERTRYGSVKMILVWLPLETSRSGIGLGD